jgi:hypothetical protein
MVAVMSRGRVLAAAAAALLLAPAAPAAAECVNVARIPGSYAYASSTHSSGLYPARGLNNGVLESGASQGYWNDDTNGVWPDWAAIGLVQARPISRIVAKVPTIQAGFPIGETTLARARVQYLDYATGWTDVTGRSGQDNPIVDWHGPLTADGSEARSFDLATPVTTTAVRVVIDAGSTDGWSWLAELEAYDCTPTNLALPRYGGTAFVSSDPYGGIADELNRGAPNGRYWIDGTPGAFPDHAGIEWRSAQTFNRVVLRGPLWRTGMAPAERILHQSRLQYWDAAGSTWTDVVVTGPGQTNPLIDWQWPLAASSWDDVATQFDFAPIATTRIRVLIEDGNGYGNSVLDEIEAYLIS